ncbi:MAG TPA: hypothetical protein VH092_02150, partial [Urbifossiella sp.]|nr:hypothetical protein [Urbifossiella sp.]
MGDPGDQFYVTQCGPTDAIGGQAGYAVRAASRTDDAALDAAAQYPPYDLPAELWKDPPPAVTAPRRLARTGNAAGGVWVAHSVYLPAVASRDRSSFSHLLLLAGAEPADVLRSWGAPGWATSYPPGAPQALPEVSLPVGTLVNDTALTAFLGDPQPGPAGLGLAVCPPRVRGPVGERRDLLARTLHAVLLVAAQTDPQRRRLFFHAEPGLVALLLYGAVRLLPRSAVEDLTFSTYEPYHRGIRDYDSAAVVGTYLGAIDAGLEPDLGTTRGVALDTFAAVRSSPELRKSPREVLPEGVLSLIDLAARGEWGMVDDIHQTVGADWDWRGWVAPGGREAVPAIPRDKPTAPKDDPLDLADGGTVNEPGADDAPARAKSKLPPVRPSGAMTYAAQISRTNPACLLFLVDQSKSMADPFVGGDRQSKAAVVADALNRLIQNVVLRSAKADGVRDYFRIGVIGYGAAVKPGLGGSFPFDLLVPVSRLGANPLRVEARTKLVPDGAGGVVEQKVKFPVWFDAVAGGRTPMCDALAAGGLAVKTFVDEFPDAYPPIVLNLTDGLPTDGNPQRNARLLTNLGTSDGSALLFNLLISSKPVPADYFPATEERLP